MAVGDKIKTFAEIGAQNIHLEMPPVKLDRLIDEGDTLDVGKLKVEVWHTPGHTDSQLSFRLGNLLLSGDNIYRDGCVGAIDAHHGSDIPAFLKSLRRIRASDVEWLLPSHGPIFRKNDTLLDQTIERLESYLHMADWGTCATDWPLMDEWERRADRRQNARLSSQYLGWPRLQTDYESNLESPRLCRGVLGRQRRLTRHARTPLCSAACGPSYKSRSI